MDLVLIENLLRLLEQSSVNEMEVTENGMRVRIAKTPRPAAATPQHPRSDSPEDSAAAQIAEILALPQEVVANDHTVVAGLIGTFYRAPSPDAAPFVQEGDHVEDGQTLGLVEAMKTFNPIEADCAGRLKSILVADGISVSAGMPLFIIEKAH